VAAVTEGSGGDGEAEAVRGASRLKYITEVDGSDAVGVVAFGARSKSDARPAFWAGSVDPLSQLAKMQPKKNPIAPAVNTRTTVMTSGDMSDLPCSAYRARLQ